MSEAERLFAMQLRAERITGWVEEFRFSPPRRWRFDFAWPKLRFAIEIEGGGWVGGRHTRGAGFERDLEKYAAAWRLGWSVLRVSPKMVRSGRVLSDVSAYLRENKGPPQGPAL